MMRLVMLRCETSNVAEVFCPGRSAAGNSLLDVRLQVVLDLARGWNLSETCFLTPRFIVNLHPGGA